MFTFTGWYTRRPIWPTCSTPSSPTGLTPPPRLRTTRISRSDPDRLPQETGPSIQNGSGSDPPTYLLLRPVQYVVPFGLLGLHRATVSLAHCGKGLGNRLSDVFYMEKLERRPVCIQYPVDERRSVSEACYLFLGPGSWYRVGPDSDYLQTVLGWDMERMWSQRVWSWLACSVC